MGSGSNIICAIHQPNFFPWLGYFDKIKKADKFVFLDAVDYPRSGSGGMGCWCNRVKIPINHQPSWFGCPVKKAKLGTKINEVLIDENQAWRKRLLRTLEINYARSRNFTATMDVLEKMFAYQTDNLSDFNINVIKIISDILGLKTEFIHQSSIAYTGNATELLISITQNVHAHAYLCGGGADGYQDDALFEKKDVGLIYQAYQNKSYCEQTEYLPGMSVIDFMMKSEHWRI